MPTASELWKIKWFRIATITASVLILVSLFGSFRGCRSVQYWKGVAEVAEKKVKDLGYTIESLEKASAASSEAYEKQIAELRGNVDSSNTVIVNTQSQIIVQGQKIDALEQALREAENVEDKLKIAIATITELKTTVSLKDTQLAESRKIIEAKDAEIRVHERAYADLKLDFGKAMEGWRAEKERADALDKLSRALKSQNTALKLQASLGKVGGLALLALGIFAVVK